MFVNDVIRSLSIRELKRLQLVIDAHKRTSVQKLFAGFIRNRTKTETPSKEEMYRWAFGKKYDKKKDYLLRKEQQFLREAVRQFLVDEEFHRICDENEEVRELFLTKALIRLKMHAEIERIINKKDSFSSNSIFPYYRSERIFNLLNYVIMHLQVHAQHLERVDEYLESWRQNLALQYLYQFRQYKVTEAFLRYRQLVTNDIEAWKRMKKEWMEKPDGDMMNAFIDDLRERMQDADDPYSEYYRLYARLFFSTGEESMETLLRLREILVPLDKKGFEKEINLIMAEGNLATAYRTNEKFDLAEVHYLNQIGICRSERIPIRYTTIMNLFSIYLISGAHKKGIELFGEYGGQFRDDPIFDVMKTYVAFCHLFLKDTTAAVQAIADPGPDLAEYYRILHRLIHAIAFFIDDDIDLAINELTNLKAVMNFRKVKNAELFEKSVDLLHAYFKWARQPKGERQTDRLTDLRERARSLADATKQVDVDPHIVWLLDELAAR